MKPETLRRFANRYGIFSLLPVGALLLLRHLWLERRRALFVAGCVLLLAGVGFLVAFGPRYACENGHRLYLGRGASETPGSPRPIDQRILDCWEDAGQTQEVQAQVHAFALAVAQQDVRRVSEVEEALYRQFRPKPYGVWKQAGKEVLDTALGQIYLAEGWLPQAEQRFDRVLATVPPSKERLGGSFSRQEAGYGLARIHALRDDYKEAERLLGRAQNDYSNGCGNANEAAADEIYPLQVVWSVAGQPFPDAEARLQEIMAGDFTPHESWLNGDTSEEQRRHAAAEAALTLGCLYARAGRRAEATACWRLAASDNAQQTAAHFARTLLTAHP